MPRSKLRHPLVVVSLNYDYCARHDCLVNPRFGCLRCRRRDQPPAAAPSLVPEAPEHE